MLYRCVISYILSIPTEALFLLFFKWDERGEWNSVLFLQLPFISQTAHLNQNVKQSVSSFIEHNKFDRVPWLQTSASGCFLPWFKRKTSLLLGTFPWPKKLSAPLDTKLEFHASSQTLPLWSIVSPWVHKRSASPLFSQHLFCIWLWYMNICIYFKISILP